MEKRRVLLVLHSGFNKWVPPGGHIEPGELFHETVSREFCEETGLQVEVLSASQEQGVSDRNATPLPTPFYVDLEREGFTTPALVQFFWVRRLSGRIEPQESEVKDVRWFSAKELPSLKTFEQVRYLASYAIKMHPSVREAAGSSSSQNSQSKL